ncbi:myosin regulatory light chain interacting protein a [Plakobranchus ocellatus]|uniref:Myosin regulatory light chain interacting protein a n=1 Tax=Plakobranchus ocellatus TaxID=259542 RepID=A0AAV3Z8Y7_9GAST|nr:myosin regulatory light chain interacting protein a [Plakobranchus ocellatus]
MSGVTFGPSPKPKIQLEKCREWIRLCNHPHTDLSVDKTGGDHYVCSKAKVVKGVSRSIRLCYGNLLPFEYFPNKDEILQQAGHHFTGYATMWCYISLPNEQCIEIEIDTKQTGRVILDKVLEKLGIVEVDYFGLQYKGSKNEALWINLRNRMCDHEINGSTHVYRLSLRVKFFVQPHLIQQEGTKELFYNQAKDMIKKGLISLDAKDCDEGTLAKIVACICQAEHGDQTCNMYQNTLYLEILKGVCPPERELSPSFVEQISMEHSSLRGVSHSSACYLTLKEVSILPSYGQELHRASTINGADVTFAVGPEGITIHYVKTCTCKSIPYSQIRLATHSEKCVNITLINDFGEAQSEELFKLRSRKAAVALYRCITEMHSFYRCDTVGSNVQSQYCRDFKGTFVSIFNENSDLGKRYIFDIQRTSQEAYDLVRRKLYAKASSPLGSPSHCSQLTTSCAPCKCDSDNDQIDICDRLNGNDSLDVEKLGDDEMATLVRLNKNQQREVKKLKRRIEHLEDSLTCCICMDKQVCVVLCPCGHMTCDDCSSRIAQCPQCRTEVERFQKVFPNVGIGSREKVHKESEHVV